MINIKNPLPSNSPLIRVDINSVSAVDDIKQAILFLAQQRKQPTEKLVLVCIGTDRSTGDALGPLTGSWVNAKKTTDIIVLGTLEQPVHAVNLCDCLKQLPASSQKPPLIIAVDACLGKQENVGSISIRTGPLKPGAGVSKELPPVGDISIHGIVNVGGFLEYLVLQSTRLSLVVKMAEIIGAGIINASWDLYAETAKISSLSL